MPGIHETICNLVCLGDVLVSEHGYDALADDNLNVKEIIESVQEAYVVEEYPDYSKGSCILLLQKSENGGPVHVVWGIPKGYDRPAVLVMAYRPDPNRWDASFMRRR